MHKTRIRFYLCFNKLIRKKQKLFHAQNYNYINKQ
jgi:hypothetical protein